MARELVVRIVGDSRDLERALDRSTRSARKFEANISGVGRSLHRAFAGAAAAVGVGFGLRTLVDGIESAVTASSDLAESISKTNVVFGSSAREIRAWSKTTTNVLGISQQQALETASTFGALFAPLGIVGDEAADQSRKLTVLGADLASFYNTSVQDALDAIRSGLVGEAEPLRRYGALLSETRVVQEALLETHKKTATSLTVEEKLRARVNLIFHDTVKAQGDAARSSQRYAGQVKILQAQYQDLAGALGQVLTPKIVEATKKMTAWLADPENKQQVIEGFARATTQFGRAAEVAAKSVGLLARAWNDAVKKRDNFWSKLPKALRVPSQEERLRQFGAGPGDFGSGGGAGGGGNFPIPPGWGNPTALKLGVVGAARSGGGGGGAAATGPSAAQRNQWFDAMIGRQLVDVQDVATTKGQIGRLQQISGLLTARLAVTKDITRKLTLEDQIKEVAREQRGLQEQLATQAQDAAAAATDERMGWLAFAVERAEATKTVKDDLKANRDLEKVLVGRIRQEGRTLDLVRQLWETRQKIADLNKSKSDVDPMAGLMQVGSARLARILAAGTGLGAAGTRRLGQNIAGAELRPLTIPVMIDNREIGRATRKDDARTGGRTSRQTSGRRG